MFQRFMCAVAVAMAMTTSAAAGGHRSNLPDDGVVAYVQHRLADATGWAWLHPVMPVPTHGQHAALEMARPDVLATAQAYRGEAAVARWMDDAARYGRDFANSPTMENQHRLDEATMALAQTLVWVGRGDPGVTRMAANLEAALRLNGDDSLCLTEGILARDAQIQSPDLPTVDRIPLWVWAAGLLLMVAGAMQWRRRVT